MNISGAQQQILDKEKNKEINRMSEIKSKTEINPMAKIKLEKVVLSCGAKGADIAKSTKLLEMISKKKPQTIKAGPRRRIPAFGVKPGIDLGVMVTLRGKEAEELLKNLLISIDNFLDKRQIAENAFSFGIKEYIEIPGMEYQRDIGIRGLNVTTVFIRPGARVKKKKIKKSKVPRRHNVKPEEIIKFMEENFHTEIE